MSEQKDSTDEQSLDNRSWLEICDEELQGEIKLTTEFDDKSTVKYELHDQDETIKSEPKNYETVKSEPDDIDESKEEGEITSDSINLSVIKEEIHNDQGFASTAAISNILSYAKVLSQGTKSEEKYRKHKTANIPTDDLSLTSHLDIFHVDSPCKEIKKEETEIDIMLDEDTVMFSPVKKEENPSKNMKRPFKLIDSPLQNKRERTNSVHSTHKVAKSDKYSDVHSSKNDADKNSTSPGSKRELEVNPDVLCRRQKQIDYGKNTVGYERYCQLIPKHKRNKEHPKTPPKHLKMSRRAWDGLVKNWRLKLHKWDPAGENDDFDLDSVNFDQYSLSSEVSSSYDSSSVKSDSTPSTPSQSNSMKEDGSDLWSRDRKQKPDKSKELWPNCPQKSDKSDDEEYLGCESLNENCVKACS